jgi:hypothetical protein
MDETLKKAVAGGLLGTVTMMGAAPVVECNRNQLCGIEAPELWHIHEDGPAPAPTNSGVIIVAATSASSSLGVYTLVSEHKGSPVFFIK